MGLKQQNFGRPKFSERGKWAELVGPARLIIFRKKHCCHRPIGLGNDPELHLIGIMIHGKEAQPFTQGKTILCVVFHAHLTPVPAHMAVQGRFHVRRIEDIASVGSNTDLA